MNVRWHCCYYFIIISLCKWKSCLEYWGWALQREGLGGPFPENKHWRTDGGQGISEVRAERQGRAHVSLHTEGI